jgi:hypothetical protein
MRKILGAMSLSSVLMFTLAVNAAAPTNFAGTWTLDKSKSEGLNPRMQGADSVSLVINQTAKDITIEEKVTGGQMGGGQGGPPGGGGGGGGRGGMMGGGGPRTYNLDGSETTADVGRGKAVRKAAWSNDGKTLELTSKTTFQGPDGEITNTISDKLELSSDGKVLTDTRHSDGPRGPQNSKLVFNK